MILTADDYVLALDISTSTGVAEGRPGETPTLSVQSFSEADDDVSFERAMGRALIWIGTRFAASSGLPLPTRVVIEGSQTGGFGGHTTFNTTRMLFGLLGIFTGAARAKNIPINAPAVSTIRKAFIGHGRLPGPQAKRQVTAMCRLLGWAPPDHNAADAGAAWFWFVTSNFADPALPIRHRLLLKDLTVEPGQERTRGRPVRR